MLSDYTALADFCEAADEPMKASYSVRQVAALTGLNPHTVYDELDCGRLNAFLPRGRERGVKIRAAEVNRWLEEAW